MYLTKPGSDYTGTSTGTGGVTFPNSYFTFGKDKDPNPWEAQYLNQIFSGSPSLKKSFTNQQDWLIFMDNSKSNNDSSTMLSICKDTLYTGYEGMVLSGYPGSNRPAPMAIQTTSKDDSFWRDGRIIGYNRDVSVTTDTRAQNFPGYYFVQRGFRSKMSNPDYLSSVINSFPLTSLKPTEDKIRDSLPNATDEEIAKLLTIRSFAWQKSVPRMNAQAGITGPQCVTPGIDDLSQYGNWPKQNEYPTFMNIQNAWDTNSPSLMKSTLFNATLKIGFTSSTSTYNVGVCNCTKGGALCGDTSSTDPFGCHQCAAGSGGSDIQQYNAMIPTPNYT